MAVKSNREKMEEAILVRVREIMASVDNPDGLDISIHMVCGCTPEITYTVKNDVVRY